MPPRLRVAQPRKLGSVLSSVLDQLGHSKKLMRYAVLERWGEVVGSQIAGVTTAEKMDGGKLYIRVSRSAWRNELVFLKREIIEKLNGSMKEAIVEDIIFR